MSTDTLWGNRRPGDAAMVAAGVDPLGGRGEEEDDAIVVIADFHQADAFGIPAETKSPDGGPHPFAGKRVRVTFAFRSLDPTGRNKGHHFVHLWNQEAGFGVCEVDDCFVGYETATFPESWPKLDKRIPS